MKHMFYFIFALTAVLAATEEDFNYETVLDTDGHRVIGGRSYYFVPAVRGQGGGLGVSGRGDKKCHLYIVQESSEDNDGIPVKFSEWMNDIGFVAEKQSLLIEMDMGDKICCEQTYWKPDSYYDKERKQFFVTAGSKESWLTSSFDLIKSGDGYMFKLYPSYDFAGSSKLCSSSMGNYVEIFVDEKGVRRLALNPFSSEPLVVKFKKAKKKSHNLSSKTI